MLTLEYYNQTKSPISGEIFEELLDYININFQHILPDKLDKRKNYMITLTIVDDELIKKLNKEFRGQDKPTDVISMCYLEKQFPGQDMIGEIFISIDTAKKQAKKLKHDLNTEIKFLFVHGILHVLGYEHAEEEDFQLMMELSNQIIEKT